MEKQKPAIVVSLHGDEHLSLEIGKRLKESFPVFVGNPEAIKQGKRFIESDMNRVFPGKEEGNYEEKRAFNILRQIKEFDYVVDIHTSSSDISLFGIITKPTKYNVDFARKLGLNTVLFMTKELAKGGSLIDYHPGSISLEFGPHDNKERAEEVIKLIENFPCNKSDLRVYQAFDMVKGEAVKFYMKNLQKVKKGDLIAEGEEKYYAEYDFIPFFVGERAYKGILCLAAKEFIF